MYVTVVEASVPAILSNHGATIEPVDLWAEEAEAVRAAAATYAAYARTL